MPFLMVWLIYFVLILLDSKTRLLNIFWPISERFLEPTTERKQSKPLAWAGQTMPKNGVFSWVQLCLRSHGWKDVEYETLDYVTSKLGYLLLRVQKVRNFHLSKWTFLPVPWMARFLRAGGRWWYRPTRDLTRSRVGYWLIFISVFFLQKKIIN